MSGNKSKINKIEWLFAMAVLSLVTAVSLNWAMKGAIHYKKDIPVPDLVGKSLTEALEILSSSNLGLRKEGAEFNEAVPQGTILRQQPPSGLTVREGKIIQVMVSQGGQTITVPNLIGQSLRSAEISLRTNFLSLGEINSRPSLKFQKDTIVEQQPQAGTNTTKNSLVHITLSNGAPQDGAILMPDFIGKKWEDVQIWAEKFSIETERIQDPSSSMGRDTIVQQEVAPDTQLTSSTKIKFTAATR